MQVTVTKQYEDKTALQGEKRHSCEIYCQRLSLAGVDYRHC